MRMGRPRQCGAGDVSAAVRGGGSRHSARNPPARTNAEIEKGPRWLGALSRLGVWVRRCPTLPHPPGCSTIGAVGLSFRVRNGTGRFPHAMTAVTLLPVPARVGAGWEDCGYNMCSLGTVVLLFSYLVPERVVVREPH